MRFIISSRRDKASLLASEWYEGGLEARSERRRLEEAEVRARRDFGCGEGDLEATLRREGFEERLLLLEERDVRERDEEGMAKRTVGQSQGVD